MMSVILKRSSSTASRRTLAALASVDSVLPNLQIHFNPATSVLPRNTELLGEIRCFSRLLGMPKGGSDAKTRKFHAVSRPLNFRSSLVSQSDFATARQYSFDEEKGAKGDSDEGLDIAKLEISQQIVSALAKKNITKLFPIQRAVLEPAMQGRDMIGRARTGTGKTLAFGIPILDKIIRHNVKNGEGKYPLAVVMAPTRELANQVKKEFSESAPELLTVCIYGGVPIGSQMRQLDRGVDVVVGTPGRLIDLMNRGALVLSEVQFLVLDEADQMLQVGFQEDVERIMERLPSQRQSLMFSATMPSWIKDLSRKYLRDPLIIDLVGDSDQKLADGISLYSIMSDTYRKASIIEPLVTEHAKGGKCIVFTQTKRDADRLSHTLEGKLKCQALHGDISQSQRERTLSGFREGYFNVLVATDVAARGLDVPNVDLVIHYDLPNSSEIFIHRSGRTGRAGKSGTAILIHSQDQTKTARLIERDVGRRFTELPKINVEGGAVDMFSDLGGGGRYGSGGMRERGSGRYGGRSGGYGDSGFGRSGGYGNSGFGRSGSYGDSGSGRSGGYGDSGSGRSGGYGDSGSGRSGGYGNSGSGRSGGYSSSGFGNSSSSGRFGSFGSPSSSQSQSSFGQEVGSWEPKGADRSGGFDSFGSGRRSGFGDLRSSQGTSFNKRFGDGRKDGQDDGSF